MESQKRENILNLALEATGEERERSIELDVGFAKEEKVYGVSHAGLDEAFDYINFKAQLKDEDVKVDVLESKITPLTTF